MDANALLAWKMGLHAGMTVSLVALLVWYELHRKWDKLETDAKGLASVVALVTRYRVAWIIAAVLVPDWADILPKLLNLSQ